MVVISPQSGNVLKTIPTSKQPIAVKIDNKRGRIYVTALEGGSVSIYSSKNYRHLKTLKLNPAANSLAINPTDGSVYVSVKNFSSKNKTNKEKKEKVVRLQF
ncbi:TPA: YncE family protein [Escherichia coli]